MKLEEAIALLIVEALGLSRLRFVKAETWIAIFSESRLQQMLNNALTLRACYVTSEFARNKNVTAGKEYECLIISLMKSRIEITGDVEQLLTSVDRLTIIEEKDKFDEKVEEETCYLCAG
ncbi:uncharacterized protein MONOS_8570 [Monocercomonoides exilis]|uniref:uncharacterized protein n=1 Tax=Monocercomonoides exilis TaxID=2049356 RepID=UPI0035594B99|nr:hypothetical protein MONOS_8570 [Monocercomonoides exilis]|eukprot:MONOS_8570.1-p1 / transcript=MONOS_8570.1 / gene=MONOS_8570 / organism=Monocercomonoides_exilis_PA203 / gene_product=unspecified product / transcript_product=unspecified product / location=Mono_scaffold00326:44405-44764(+) / protein_length=120 / sequence_SO=supercontig / SO=protein_coding / is_pseudo=false